MKANLAIDPASLRALESTMQRYAREMNRSAEYTVNRTLQNIAGWAAHETIKADRERLAAELGAPASSTGSGGARAIRRPAIQPTTVAKARYAANLRRKGLPIPPEPMFTQKVRAMVAAILRSVAFMKAGWLPAFRALKARQAELAFSETAAFGGRWEPGYGDVSRARETGPGWEGEIANQSVNRMDPGSWPALERYAGSGLDRAVRLKIRDMEDFLDREAEKNARLFNGS